MIHLQNLLFYPTKLGVAVILVVFLALGMPALVWGQDAGLATPSDKNSVVEALADAIRHLLRKNPRHRLRRDPLLARITAGEILDAARATDLDPFLVLSTAYRESTLRTEAYNPGKGEYGIMQCHGKAAKGCDQTTSRGQILCGASWLRSRIDHCGSVRAGIAAYVSGSCQLSGHAAWAAGDRLRMAERLGRFMR